MNFTLNYTGNYTLDGTGSFLGDPVRDVDVIKNFCQSYNVYYIGVLVIIFLGLVGVAVLYRMKKPYAQDVQEIMNMIIIGFVVMQILIYYI